MENCTGLFDVGFALAGRLVNRMIRLLREGVISKKGSSDSRFKSTLHPNANHQQRQSSLHDISHDCEDVYHKETQKEI